MPDREPGDVKQVKLQQPETRTRDYEAAGTTGHSSVMEKPRRIRSAPLASRRELKKTVWPPVWLRLVNLVLRPESWAEAMRHPLRYTLVPLVVAIVLAGLAAGIGSGMRAVATARTLAAVYDEKFSPISYVGGKLSYVGDSARPVRLTLPTGEVIIDPAGKIKPDDVLGNVMIFGENKVTQRSGGLAFDYPLAMSPLPMAAPDGTVITSAWLNQAIDARGWALAAFVGGMAMVSYMLGNAIWAALTILLVGPVVQLSAAALRIPQRVAYRGAAAIAVPLVVLGGALSGLGFSPDRAMPAEWVLPFWFIASVLLACWTGVLAGRLYRKGHKRRAM